MIGVGGGWSAAGRRLVGGWPGLAEAALDHGDLAGTTDFRSVVGELLVRHGLRPDLGLARPRG
jgi:uncharacterized protein (DUF1501 family)